MSLPANTINTLQNIQVKPEMWILRQDIYDGEFRLSATYVEPSRGEYFEITTARGDTKIYRTVQAAISDARKVMASPIIQFHFESK